jgi:hypothetical protein
MAYDNPKSEVEGFDGEGGEVRLKAPITDLKRYVKKAVGRNSP